MTQDEIIRMAREVDAITGLIGRWIFLDAAHLERFAALVAAHEREKLAEQEPVAMDDHPPHRLCECRKCMEYFTPLPDCDAFVAFGKPIAEQTNTQLMEGYRIGLAEMREKCAKVCKERSHRSDDMGAICAAAIRAIKFEGDTGFRPVSEMIAEHKRDPKKAAAIEKAKMRKAEREPVAEVVLRSHKVGFGRTEERKDIVFLADVEVGTKLYAAPVRTKDLTDDEIDRIWLKMPEKDEFEDVHWFARAVIAADREKNNANNNS